MPTDRSKDHPKPMLLLILDGWGYREEKEYNAIAAAHTPVWDELWDKYSHTLLDASGESVGLPAMQMGNSEVGHMNIGAGRVVYQDLARIDKAIEDGDFFNNPALVSAIDKAVAAGKAVHVMGLLSPGGVHSQEHHWHALAKLAAERGAGALYFHAFLDGRDTPPQSAQASLEKLEQVLEKAGCGRIVSIVGRYYAMDRDKRWERTQKGYELVTAGEAEFTAETAVEGLKEAYDRGETDEFVQATRIGVSGSDPVRIDDDDAVIFMNFRADRARQLSRALVQDQFNDFARGDKIQLGAFVTLTQYADDIPAQVAFGPQALPNVLGEHLAKQGLSQLRIAETEKYAHVTFFFNGGVETPFPNETRTLIHSPKVATYDLQPEMSAEELTDNLVGAISGQEFDVIICNYANPDMVGHTGDFDAAVKAIEAIDKSLGKITQALHAVGGEALITADHGNAEYMFDDSTGQSHTAHTTNLVPLLYIGREATPDSGTGAMCDIAPTLLSLIGLDAPSEMTGRVLFKHGR